VVVWTPGMQSGRPLQFAALPDFENLKGDDLEQALQMAVESLAEPAGIDSGAKSNLRTAVLKKCLEYFAAHGGRSLDQLTETLDSLPEEATAGIKDANKLAAAMADNLKAALTNDRLLAGSARGADPGELLRSAREGVTRI